MFSMSNADELRQRAEQQQKQQKPDPKDDAEGVYVHTVLPRGLVSTDPIH